MQHFPCPKQLLQNQNTYSKFFFNSFFPLMAFFKKQLTAAYDSGARLQFILKLFQGKKYGSLERKILTRQEAK